MRALTLAKDAEETSEKIKVIWPAILYVVSPARLISLRRALTANDIPVLSVMLI